MFSLSSIDEAIKDIAQGKMIIVVDDEDRENEGDLVMASELISPEAITFMATHARGLICASITPETAQRLDLSPMTSRNTAHHQTAFTVSIDAAKDISTGISSFDRAHTIKLLTNPSTSASDFVRPGHIFPLIAKKGGILERPGHTEASLEIAQMAKLKPSAVICEIINDDGTMARLPDLQTFAQKHDLKIVSIKDLIEYKKSKKTTSLNHKLQLNMPTHFGNFDLHTFKQDDELCFALKKGKLPANKPTLTRIHSECFTGELLHSKRCECAQQLHESMRMVEEEGEGIILYLRQEGRGIGLWNKLKAYDLQDKGYNTVEANIKLGFAPDLRDFEHAAQMLNYFGISDIRLITNNPYKVKNIKEYGINVCERIPIEIPPNEVNRGYLTTKKNIMNHIFKTIHKEIA